jgi:hypothetical protein
VEVNAVAVLVALALTCASGASSAGGTTTTHRLSVEVIPLMPHARSSSSLYERKASTSGTVTSSPSGIDCPDTSCSAEFADGTAVTLTATPGSGWRFIGWYVDCTGQDACVLTMDRDRTVQVVFFFDVLEPPLCHVPKLVGLLLRKAVARINNAHCKVGKVVRRHSTIGRKGRVLAQSPRYGTRRPHDAKVNLIVGKGPKRK